MSALRASVPSREPEQWVPGRPVQTRGCIEHTSISVLLHKLLCIQKWRREQKLFFSQSLTRKLMGTDRITASPKHCHLFAKKSYRCSRGFASARLYLSWVHLSNKHSQNWPHRESWQFTQCTVNCLGAKERLNPGFPSHALHRCCQCHIPLDHFADSLGKAGRVSTIGMFWFESGL